MSKPRCPAAGRRPLLESGGNDFKPAEPTLIRVFAVEKKELE